MSSKPEMALCDRLMRAGMTLSRATYLAVGFYCGMISKQELDRAERDVRDAMRKDERDESARERE